MSIYPRVELTGNTTRSGHGWLGLAGNASVVDGENAEIRSETSLGPSRHVIEYETATGKRSPLITAVQLTPKGVEKALNVEDYQWDR